MSKLYHDLAGATLPELLPALLSIADPDRILYGSDWPFTKLQSCLELAAQLDTSPLVSEMQHRSFVLEMLYGFFPRLTLTERNTQ